MPINVNSSVSEENSQYSDGQSTTVSSANLNQWDSSLEKGSNRESMKSSESRSTSTPSPPPLPAANGVSTVEVGKEAKEKKSGSWMKTIGMRTLRLRHKNSEVSKSRASIPAELFGSLDRKGKKGKTAEKSQNGDEEHVKKAGNGENTANGKNSNGSGENGTDKQDPARFLGEGLTFKAKLIGVLEVSGPRGDRICQEALSELKMAVKAAGEHKQKITIHIALDGIRLRDEKTGDCLYHHQVHKISFIAQDLTDARAFGYIFGSPDTGHRFFGIKTEKSASQVVIAMRDLFQVVFDLKKKEIERAKQQLEMQQKYLGAGVSRPTDSTKSDGKTSSIAETYIEGACALTSTMSSTNSKGSSSSPAPAEVDLLNLEVELNSLQEGLETIHHNLLQDSLHHAPFKGSTASISSCDPSTTSNPPVSSNSSCNNIKFPSSSSAAISNTMGSNSTPVPSSDPFLGDNFDPFDNKGTTGMSTSMFTMGSGSNNNKGGAAVYSSSSFSTVDPFANVDPFDSTSNGNKYDGDFFNCSATDPFDSPTSGINNSMEAKGVVSTMDSSGGMKNTSISRGLKHSGVNRTMSTDSYMEATHKSGRFLEGSGSMQNKSEDEDWKASFEDSFPPVSSFLNDDFSRDEPSKPSSIFTELDPLGAGRTKPLLDSKLFFQDVKNPPKKMLKELCANNIAGVTFTKIEDADKLEATLSNSFSTNFNPAPSSSSVIDSNHRYETPPHHHTLDSSPRAPRLSTSTIRSSGADSPPPGSPSFSMASNNEYFSAQSSQSKRSTTNSTPPILPPPCMSSPAGGIKSSPATSSERSRNKSNQLLKQITIATSSPSAQSSRTNSVRYDFPGGGYEEIPSLVPPPRPPHTNTATLTKQQSGGTKAVPRPSSGLQDQRKNNSSNPLGGVIPPEPPPRPIQSTMGVTPMQLVSPPPPLPPKKQQGLVVSAGSRLLLNKNAATDTEFFSSATTTNNNNDLPLPLPSRKRDDQLMTRSSRYEVPPSVSNSIIPNNTSMSLCEELPRHNNSKNITMMTMEQALSQVATLSLGDLATKLCLPVEKLSSLTIRELAEKLIFDQQKQEMSKMSHSGKKEVRTSTSSGFEDDFAPMSAPLENTSSNKNTTGSKMDQQYDKYAVFRELTLEDASGFSVEKEFMSGSRESVVSDDGATLKDFPDHLTSSSERTLKADDNNILGAQQQMDEMSISGVNNSIANNNTMDDITDGNLSEDDARFTFELDEDDNIMATKNSNEGSGGVTEVSQWATFESNFEDQFASLMKDNDDEEEESTEEEKSQKLLQDNNKLDPFDFQPFEKPKSFEMTVTSNNKSGKSENNLVVVRSSPKHNLDNETPDILSSPGQFTRQSSCSSKHSRTDGRVSEDYSDSPAASRRRRRRSSRDEADDVDFYQESRRAHKGKHRLHESSSSYRPDSGSSYSSRRKYRPRTDSNNEPPGSEELEDTEDRTGSSSRKNKSSRGRHYYEDNNESRPTSGREYLGPEDDERSYASSTNNSMRGASYHSRSQKNLRVYEDGGESMSLRRKHHHHHRRHYDYSPPSRRRSNDEPPRRYDDESDDGWEEESPYDDSGSESRHHHHHPHNRRNRRSSGKDYSSSSRTSQQQQQHYNDSKRHHHRPASGNEGKPIRYSHYGTNPRTGRTSSPRDYHNHHHHAKSRRSGRRYYYDDDEYSDDFSASSNNDEEGQYYYKGRRSHHHHHGRKGRPGRHSPAYWDSESGPEVVRRRGSYNSASADQYPAPAEDSSPTRRKKKMEAMEPCSEQAVVDSPRKMNRSHEMDNLKNIPQASTDNVTSGTTTNNHFSESGGNSNKSPFEDNFVPPEEEKLMFFPASFDTENNTSGTTEKIGDDNDDLLDTTGVFSGASGASPVTVGDSGNSSANTTCVLGNKRGGSFSKTLVNRLESIRSEEEDGGNTSTTTHNNSDSKKDGKKESGTEQGSNNNHNGGSTTGSPIKEEEEEISDSMKKSDSFNIFQQAKINDPFAEDDFFA